MKQAVADSISPTDWLIQNLAVGSRVAFDPQLYAYRGIFPLYTWPMFS